MTTPSSVTHSQANSLVTTPGSVTSLEANDHNRERDRSEANDYSMQCDSLAGQRHEVHGDLQLLDHCLLAGPLHSSTAQGLLALLDVTRHQLEHMQLLSSLTQTSLTLTCLPKSTVRD